MNSVLCVGRVLSRVFWNGFANLNTNPTTNTTGLDSSSTAASAASASAAVTATSSTAAPVTPSTTKQPHLITAVCGFPKYRSLGKYMKGRFGDDAWFTAKSAKADVIGIADGVGGWRSYGIDPSEFPVQLMQICERYVNIGRFSAENPLELLKNSYQELVNHRRSVLGSSTACVLILNKENRTIYTSNIGDSGFVIVRDGRVILRSREQQHYFNTPFQLSLPPPTYRMNVLADRPDAAQVDNIKVQNGDVILLASDGVFDNLPDRLLIAEMSKVQGIQNVVQLQTIANSIAWMSRCLSYDDSFFSPFAKSAYSNGIITVGGKPDDITVLLATVII